MPYRRFEPDQPYRLVRVDTGELVCTISGAQLDDLLDRLVREHAEDRDYWIDHAILDWLTNEGADPQLVGRLRVFIERRGPSEIAWAKER